MATIIREIEEEEIDPALLQAMLDEQAAAEEEEAEQADVELSPNDEEFVDNLVMTCILFIEDLCDTKFYPYQREVAYRIIESVVLGDGEEITVLQARQSGKTETLANVLAGLMILLPRLAKAYPDLLGKYAKGFWVGTFAPTEEQADTVWGRIVDRLSSERAIEYLLDPEIEDKVTKEGGKSKCIRLKNSGSLCRRQTCNPKAKIESKSYHFVLVDECQEADSFVVTKSIGPMLAFYNGTRVYTGTPTREKNIFYKAIQLNKRRQTKRGVRQNHFEYNYKFVCKYNANYRKFIAKEKVRLGEDSDEFQMSYNCVAPDTMVLTADLRYVRAGDLVEGDLLVGFDEERLTSGAHRNFRESAVTSAKRIMRPSYRTVLSDGTEVVSSNGHLWLVLTAGRRTVWKRTDELLASDRIFKVAQVWAEQDRSYESGYLAAAFDGEGHLLHTKHGQFQLVFSQRENAMLANVREFLTLKGYSYWERTEGGGTNGDVVMLGIGGGKAETLRFLGEMRPARLLAKFNAEMLGSIGRHDRRTGGFEHPRVVSNEFLGETEVVALETTTKTFVAEGLASHNCKWLLDQGMFITEEKFDLLGDSRMRLYKSWFKSKVVVGIDPARTKDSTVVTVLWVDWDRPDSFGFYEHRILNWLEITNKEWEKQYYEIYEFLSHYNILRIGVDSTGMGSAVYDRIRVLFPDVEVIECPSDAKTQAERWKHLTAIVEREALVYPAHSTVKRLRPFKRFRQQMIDLETKMRGPYLLAQAPDENEAHDDYPDSLAIACSMTLMDTLQEAEAVDSPFVGRRR